MVDRNAASDILVLISSVHPSVQSNGLYYHALFHPPSPNAWKCGPWTAAWEVTSALTGLHNTSTLFAPGSDCKVYFLHIVKFNIYAFHIGSGLLCFCNSYALSSNNDIEMGSFILKSCGNLCGHANSPHFFPFLFHFPDSG